MPNEDEYALLKNEIEELKKQKESNPIKTNFNWTAFFVMLIAITAAMIVGTLIPGPLDEIIMMMVITAINGFMAANGFSIKNVFKK
jgi:hypothetical protein